MKMKPAPLLVAILVINSLEFVLISCLGWVAFVRAEDPPDPASSRAKIAPHCVSPERSPRDATYRSPLMLDRGRFVRRPVDGECRHQEIRSYWNCALGPRPAPVALRQFEVPASRPSSDWTRVIEASRAIREELPKAASSVLDRAEKRAAELLEAVPRSDSADSCRNRSAALRSALRTAVGVDRFPDPRPRKIEKRGEIDRGDHIIERLVWESLPDVRVPVHVYRPKTSRGRLPAVLHVPGHWWADSKSRPEFQALNINLARLGFVVLTYDPIGQGERGISFREHRRTASLLVGVSQQGFVVHESRCALSYLRSRGDVDARRIAITGASGGGYNTWMMSALDENIACAIPVVGTSEFLEQIRVCRPLDWYRAKEHCHFVPGLLGFANNHEILSLVAPRPLLVISAAGDESFPLAGIREIVGYGRALYDSFGADSNFDYFEDDRAGHGYQQRKREAAYGFLLRHLQGVGDGKPLAEAPTKTLAHDSVELGCFGNGRRESAGPGTMAWIRSQAEVASRERGTVAKNDARKKLLAALGLASQAIDSPAVRAPTRRGESIILAGVRVEEYVVPSFDGLALRATLVRPIGECAAVVVAVSGDGRDRLLESPLSEAVVRSGQALLLVDVRGIGELSVKPTGWLFAVQLLCGENLVGQQAGDLITARRALTELDGLAGRPVGVYGRGPGASLAALYASVIDEEFMSLIYDGGFLTFHDWIERPRALEASFRLVKSRGDAWAGIDREIPHALVPFDALRYIDLPDLFRALDERPVFVTRAIDGDGDLRSAEAVLKVLVPGGRLTIDADDGTDSVASWIRQRGVSQGGDSK